MREKEKTILEITARIDMPEKNISERIESPAYRALLRKASLSSFLKHGGSAMCARSSHYRICNGSADASHLPNTGVCRSHRTDLLRAKSCRPLSLCRGPC